MSDYMLAPGARLEIGPHGTPYETLGACCAGCAGGKGCGGAKAVGDFTVAGVVVPMALVTWGAIGLGAWWLFLRKKHRRNPARRYRRHRRSRRNRR